MPALPTLRQAAVSAWFDMEAAKGLRVVEHQQLLAALSSVPAQPWLWLAPTASWLPAAALPGRGLSLYHDVSGYAGSVRCHLPLPLPAESVNAIVLQHVNTADAQELLDECARVLMPGGQLWLTALNPFSPWRAHWRQQGIEARTSMAWRSLLRRAGLHCAPTRYLGPLWQQHTGASRHLPALRAVCLLQADKRVGAAVGPTPVPAPVRWQRQVAT